MPLADGLEELDEQPANARPEASPTAITAETDRGELAPMISLLSSTRVRDLLSWEAWPLCGDRKADEMKASSMLRFRDDRTNSTELTKVSTPLFV
ncbi:hypothetical protein GCM10009838_71200 [Catenulispora subtropica]|uniref:Uncharacterized protein n=1 Tax=Catenulispora subtropica TaxID=450798 RepID=A0ABP5EH39_9ACTN